MTHLFLVPNQDFLGNFLFGRGSTDPSPRGKNPGNFNLVEVRGFPARRYWSLGAMGQGPGQIPELLGASASADSSSKMGKLNP